jgi:hypothetical protein
VSLIDGVRPSPYRRDGACLHSDNSGAVVQIVDCSDVPAAGLTMAERRSAAVADRLPGFQAAAPALGAVIPPLISLAMGASAGAFALAIAPLCLTAAPLHIAMQMPRRR